MNWIKTTPDTTFPEPCRLFLLDDSEDVWIGYWEEKEDGYGLSVEEFGQTTLADFTHYMIVTLPTK